MRRWTIRRKRTTLAAMVAAGSVTLLLHGCGAGGGGGDAPPGTYQMGGARQGVALNLAATVATIAGRAGAPGFIDGSGTAARFFYPQGLTTDGANLYVADYGNHTIRKLAIDGSAVTIVAGAPLIEGSVDAIGTAARFRSPAGLTTDGRFLYVADRGNHSIRKIAIGTWEVVTLAGTTLPGFVDGAGSAARFNFPTGITTDGTSLFVADTNNHTIRKIAIGTGAVTTLAGQAGSSGFADGVGAAARFSFPYALTTDGVNLYVADTDNHTIRRIAIGTGAVTTLAGQAGSSGFADGIGASARFSFPSAITTDGTSLYVADSNNFIIRKIAIATGAVSTLAGTPGAAGSADGTGATAQFRPYPSGLTTDGRDLFVNDSGNHTVRLMR
ncbi:MAG: hypothetical protein AB1761_04900 [Pseudomonadota bacterium]